MIALYQNNLNNLAKNWLDFSVGWHQKFKKRHNIKAYRRQAPSYGLTTASRPGTVKLGHYGIKNQRILFRYNKNSDITRY
jgi:hypothetical protein